MEDYIFYLLELNLLGSVISIYSYNLDMATAKTRKNETSSKQIASLAGKVLQQSTSTKTAKKLAGSVLTQAKDKKTSSKKK